MKFGVREICDVVLRAKANQKIGNKIFYKDEPILYFDTLKTSTMEGAATTVYAQGGRGNSRLVAWEGERTVTFTMEDALISPTGFAILSGAGLVEASENNKIKIHTTEMAQVVKIDKDNQIAKIKISKQPYGYYGDNIIGTKIGEEYSVAGADSITIVCELNQGKNLEDEDLKIKINELEIVLYKNDFVKKENKYYYNYSTENEKFKFSIEAKDGSKIVNIWILKNNKSTKTEKTITGQKHIYIDDVASSDQNVRIQGDNIKIIGKNLLNPNDIIYNSSEIEYIEWINKNANDLTLTAEHEYRSRKSLRKFIDITKFLNEDMILSINNLSLEQYPSILRVGAYYKENDNNGALLYRQIVKDEEDIYNTKNTVGTIYSFKSNITENNIVSMATIRNEFQVIANEFQVNNKELACIFIWSDPNDKYSIAEDGEKQSFQVQLECGQKNTEYQSYREYKDEGFNFFPIFNVLADNEVSATYYTNNYDGIKYYSDPKNIYVMRLLKDGLSEPYIPKEIIEDNILILDMAKDDLEDLKVGDQFLVDYYTEVDSGVQQIEITPDKFGGNYYLEASTLFRTQDGVDIPADFIIPNCKIQSNFTFTMASSGDPSTFTFTMDAFPDYLRFDKSKKVLAAIQLINDNKTDGSIIRDRTKSNLKI